MCLRNFTSKNFGGGGGGTEKSQLVDGNCGDLAEFGKKRNTDYHFPPP